MGLRGGRKESYLVSKPDDCSIGYYNVEEVVAGGSYDVVRKSFGVSGLGFEEKPCCVQVEMLQLTAVAVAGSNIKAKEENPT